MKKITFSILFVMAIAVTNAQNFKPFKVDLSTGYAIPGGEGAKGGVLFAIEPKYAVISNLSVGLRFETAIMARGFADNTGQVAKMEVKAAGSYLITGDYYLTENTVRPFAGIGAGLYSLAAASAGTSGESVGSGSKFGGLARLGVELGHFRMGLEYNLVPATKIAVYDGNSTYTSETKNGYIGIKIGAVIGGGRIKK